MTAIDRWRRTAPLLAVLLLGCGWFASAAAAQEAGGRLVLRSVDSLDDSAVTAVLTWSGDDGAIGDLTATEDGEELSIDVTPAVDAGVGRDVIFVVDTSDSTDANALLSKAREALGDYFADLPANTRASLVTAGSDADILVPLTTDTARLTNGLEQLSPEGEGGLMEGVLLGIQSPSVRESNLLDVVLLTDGLVDSSVSGAGVRSGLADAHATLHMVGLAADVDLSGIAGVATSTGGAAITVASATDIGDALDSLRSELSQAYVATFASRFDEGWHELRFSLGDAQAAASYVIPGQLAGSSELRLLATSSGGGLPVINGDLAKVLGLGAATVACILFCFGLFLIFVRQEDGLSDALKPYSEGYVSEEAAADGASGGGGLTQTALLQRAVEMTEAFAQRQGVLTRIERLLEKAGVPLRAGEAMFFYLAAVVILAAAGLLLSRSLLLVLTLVLIGALIPPMIVVTRANAKKKAFEALLPDTLQLLSSTLRAGYSMMQGVEAVSQEAADPIGAELRRVVTEARLGRPLEEALESVADRMESNDFSWAVMAIRIQREVGGNLSELLLTVAETMTQRERLRRDVRSLTAEGRMSAYVLGALPIGLGLFLYVANRDYVTRLFDTTPGQIMLFASIVMIVAGFAWMFKIIKIEI